MNLDVKYVVLALLPVSLSHGMCSSNDMLSHALRWAHKRLLVVITELVVETL